MYKDTHDKGRDGREKEAERIFEETMAENFPSLMKET